MFSSRSDLCLKDNCEMVHLAQVPLWSQFRCHPTLEEVSDQAARSFDQRELVGEAALKHRGPTGQTAVRRLLYWHTATASTVYHWIRIHSRIYMLVCGLESLP